jgi:hypothetical protein
MRCVGCGSGLGEIDLLNSSCQSCGDILLPDDLATLRREMGIAPDAPPEVENPVIEATPEKVPDSVDCPGCNTPLMGEDLAQWNTGACPYCSHENEGAAAGTTQPEEVIYIPDNLDYDENENDEESSEDFELHPSGVLPELPPDGDTIPMIINVGPMVGQVIDVPVGAPVGRKDLFGLLPDPWYEKHLKRVSGEHFEVFVGRDEDERVGIVDLGSSNGTYVGGTRISGTEMTVVSTDTDINIGGNIQLCSLDAAKSTLDIAERLASEPHFYVTHNQSGIRVLTYAGVHLGRMTEGDEMERWAAMADLQLRAMGQDDSILAYLSRRHFTVSLGEDGSLSLDVFEGKEEPEVVDEGEGKWKINLRKNSFTIET